MKTKKPKKPKKHYPSDIPLADNVRLLKCGAWGYIYGGKAIFRSEDVNKVNDFAKWANEDVIGTYLTFKELILAEAKRLQRLEGEPHILPKCHLCDTPHWSGGGNHFEAVVKEKY